MPISDQSWKIQDVVKRHYGGTQRLFRKRGEIIEIIKTKKWISKFSQLHSWPPRATAAAYSEGAQALGDAMQSNYNELAHHEQRRFWKVQNQKQTDL